MGLFGGYVTNVGTAVARVIEDKLLPNSPVTGAIRSIMSNNPNASIADYVTNEIINSVGVKAERMYEYGKKEYVFGLPSGQFANAAAGSDDVKGVIETIEGTTVLLEYFKYGAPNYLHLAWMKLISDHQYDPKTNRIKSRELPEIPEVFLFDIEIRIPKGQLDTTNIVSRELWGQPATAGYAPSRDGLSPGSSLAGVKQHTPIREQEGITSPVAHVTYEWRDTTPPPPGVDPMDITAIFKRDSFDIPVGFLDTNKDYVHVKYVVNQITKYWIYEVDSGVYPVLDELHDKPTVVGGTFFPFTYFRFDKKTETEDKTTDSYKHGKKMAKYLGMDFDHVCESIDENPDIKDVEQAMCVMAVPADSLDQLSLRYLWTFFETWFYNSPGQFTSAIWEGVMNEMDRFELSAARNSIIIQDKRFKMAVNNQGIYKSMLPREGKIGEYTFSFGTTERTYEFTDIKGETGTKTDIYHTHTYTKQITETMAEQIEVLELKTKYYIWGAYAATGDEEENHLLIPIDLSMTDGYNMPDKEKLYARSLHYVFNSRVKTKLKWYQSTLFQIILAIVAVVISIFTGGAGSALMAAVAAGGSVMIVAILVTAMVNFFVGLAAQELFAAVADALGAKIAAILAVILVVLAVVDGVRYGSLIKAPYAGDLIRASSGITSGVQRNLQEEYNDLLAEVNQFGEDTAEALEEIMSIDAALHGAVRINPIIVFGETPDNFYNRTIHAGNVGTVALDAVTHYVDMALTLPTLKETIGETSNDYI